MIHQCALKKSYRRGSKNLWYHIGADENLVSVRTPFISFVSYKSGAGIRHNLSLLRSVMNRLVVRPMFYGRIFLRRMPGVISPAKKHRN